MNPTKPLATAVLAGALVVSAAAVPAAAAPSTFDRTSAVERRRVDSVPARLAWAPCAEHEGAQCASLQLPVDYDRPHGPTTKVAVLRVPARDQAHRIGSLFVNPGGPGGSATQFAASAQYWLTPAILDRFDIVGVDPRGIGEGDTVSCFRSQEEADEALGGQTFSFPVGRAEERAMVTAAENYGRACSTTGGELAGSVSTAEVARDMEVVRRAVGDPELTFLGFSYGTALGQIYANLFPDRVRAVVVDGVLDAVEWTGVPGGRNHILDERIKSSDGAWRALAEIFRLCKAAGEQKCAFAAGGDPAAKWRTITDELLREPLTISDGTYSFTITYADFVSEAKSTLYSSGAGDWLAQRMQEMYGLVTNRTDATRQEALVRRINAARLAADPDEYSSEDGGTAVICTDGLHPADADTWIGATARGDRRAPYFGRSWGWISAPCAGDTWTVRDEDAYRGPFNKRTRSPLLFVGSYWDPATNYDGAVSSSRRQPGSALLSSNNWGHTAYGTSPCTDSTIDAYLIDGTVPAKGATCTDALQPFTSGALANRVQRQRPPVATLKPRSILTGTR